MRNVRWTAIWVMVACLAAPAWSAAAPPSSAPAAAAPAAQPQILVSGVPAGAADVQKLIDAAYAQVADAAGKPATLSAAQWQQVVTAVNTGLEQAGHTGAHAYLSSDMVAFSVGGAAAAPVQMTTKLPSVPQREQATDNGNGPSIAVRGFTVEGVGQHPKQGITPASIQKFATDALAKHGGSATTPANLDFDQLQNIADAITKRYREAGFIVATAYLPAQTVDKDDIVHIDVLEGRIGKVEVQGTKHYRKSVIAASAEKLRGKPLLKSDVETALLYDRDLPGVSVSSTFQPGEKTGDTDLIMVAREAKRPYSITLGVNNYGTDVTGRYRAEANVVWNDPLGIGDKLAADIQYAFDPHQNTYGSIGYSVPFAKVPGLAFVVGADRSELQLNSGAFAALKVSGPTSRFFGGTQWKFVNQTDLSMTGSLQFIHEKSSLTALTLPLSNESFDVAQLGFALDHTDKRFHGMDMLNVAVRKSVNDDSREPDLVSGNHASSFLVTKIGYTRIQFLAPTQQLFFKLAAQYTNDALVPMEQFVIGGPDSVRAYPLADNLSDRGFYSSLEYHVDAPGFANKPSPFHGEPWRELLTFEGFVDFARGFPAGADYGLTSKIVTYKGVGAGVIFHLPRWHNLLFHLDGAVPFGSRPDADKDGFRIYGRFDLTF